MTFKEPVLHAVVIYLTCARISQHSQASTFFQSYSHQSIKWHLLYPRSKTLHTALILAPSTILCLLPSHYSIPILVLCLLPPQSPQCHLDGCTLILMILRGYSLTVYHTTSPYQRLQKRQTMCSHENAHFEFYRSHSGTTTSSSFRLSFNS